MNATGFEPRMSELGYLVTAEAQEAISMNHARINHTALMCAARCGQTNSLNMLLAAGADVNIMNDDLKDALFFAADSSHYECVKILLKAGADVHGRTGEAILLAFKPKSHHVSVKIVKRLIKAGANATPINIQLFCTSDYRCMNMLLEAGADVNITDYDGSTVLHFWLNRNYLRNEKNCLQCIKRLLRAGIRINMPKGWLLGKTTLQILLDYKNIYKDDDPKTEIYKKHVYLLYAAGETLDGTEGKKIPEELKFEEEKLKLKHICREAIRKHLLKLDRHANLFVRVPDLGLPRILTEYMLYDQSLDKDNDDGDSDNDDDDVDDNIEEDSDNFDYNNDFDDYDDDDNDGDENIEEYDNDFDYNDDDDLCRYSELDF